MSERPTALQVRNGLMRSLRGLIPSDGRKTFRRNPRRAADTAPDWRLTFLLPDRYLVAPGRTAITGITVEPDPISGPLAVATGKNLEWMCQQMGLFLALVANDERIITGVLMREGEQPRGQNVVIMREAVEFPRGRLRKITVRR